jgi:hypothetical protein
MIPGYQLERLTPSEIPLGFNGRFLFPWEVAKAVNLSAIAMYRRSNAYSPMQSYKVAHKRLQVKFIKATSSSADSFLSQLQPPLW